jgi:hypothetical protein
MNITKTLRCSLMKRSSLRKSGVEVSIVGVLQFGRHNKKAAPKWSGSS